jgi:UDP-N-acetylmuramoyl-L-alanyl-D-glutamate--2,6-diaminopimelate ligase
MTFRELIADAGFDLSSLRRPAGNLEPDGAVAEMGSSPEVSGLAYRTEDVTDGTVFFCVPGFSADGHEFAPDAVARGAVGLVCERPLELGVPQLVVESARAAMAPMAATFFGRPATELQIVGITGTNGKTTTSFLLREILEAAGVQTALLGTVHSVIGGSAEQVERTTPEAIELQRNFRRMVQSGDRVCVMEVSSHALTLGRADSIEFDCAVFTNLTRDHLDFHETLDAYFESKRRLFVGSSPPVVSVVNLDDEWGRRLAAELSESPRTAPVSFAVERDADYRASDVASGAAGSRFICQAGSSQLEVELPLPGLFNVYNALAALAAAGSMQMDLHAAARALGNAAGVPGRFEPVDEGQDFSVLVDYAHTPDSLANVLRTSRELLQKTANGRRGRVVCVFGAGGDRDREKRPLMGEAARRLADHVIVTSDNPRSEDPDAIIAAVVAGAERAAHGQVPPSALEVEPDRRVAIARALRVARAHDIVVIAGKGHEQGQELAGGRKVPFDDRDVARQELRALKASSPPPK